MCLFRKHRLAKRLASVGACVDTSYLLYVNNDEPISFNNLDDCKSYLSDYRKDNSIFRLQIYRIETYSL